MDDAIFFMPRVGANYSDGYKGVRTLVVGVSHICHCQCQHKALCTRRGSSEHSDGIWAVDRKCLHYIDRDDQEYYRLSNSNEIELQSFIDGDAQYPAYSAFTYYMLGAADQLSVEQKESLWNRVAFTNFLQHFLPGNCAMPDEADVYESAYPAFKRVTEQLQPQVIYAWNPNVRDCLLNHKKDFRYIGKANMQCFLSVFLFVPVKNGLTGNALSRLKYEHGVKSNIHRPAWFKKLIIDNLGGCFEWDARRTDKAMSKLAAMLREMCEARKLGANEEHLYFLKSGDFKWKGYHMVYFIAQLKGILQLGNGANEGFNRIFGEKAIERMQSPMARRKKATKSLKGNATATKQKKDKVEEYLRERIAKLKEDLEES